MLGENWHVCSHTEQTSGRVGIYIHGWPYHFLKQNLSKKVFIDYVCLFFKYLTVRKGKKY